MKKTKIAAILLAATTLALSSCTIGGSKSSGKKKKSSSGSITSVTSGSGGSGSTSTSGEQPGEVTLSSIAVSGQQTTYYVGDTFVKPTVTASYSDGSSKNVTNSATFSGYNLSSAGSQTVNVSYTEAGVTKDASYGITVKAAAWDSTTVSTMTSHLDGVTLPFTKGTWEWEDDGSENELYGLCNDSTTSAVTAVYQAATDWEYLGLDDYGDPLFAKTTQSEGTVTVNIYENSYYKVIVYASFAPKQERTTDTDWPEEYKEVMHYILGGTEELPFFQFGEDYEIADYGLQAGVFYLEFYDSYTAEDLTSDYIEVVEAAGYTFLRTDDYGDPVYGKTTEEGTIELNIYNYEEYGNCVDASFICNKETSAMWPSFEELTAFETGAGFSVPQFEATSYTYYSRYGYVFIETETSDNLAVAYSTAAEALGYIHSYYPTSGDVQYGSVTDWEETFNFSYSILGHEQESESEEEESTIVITGFQLQMELTDPESEFVETWPEEQISEYLAGFKIEGVTVPVLDDPLSKKFKVAVLPYEDVLAEYLEYYALYIEAGMIDLATVEGWAAEDSGFFVQAYDAAGTGAATYNAKFDSTWENVTQEGDTSTSWSKNGVTVVVTQGTYYTQVQIVEPAPAPSDPITVETTIEAYATANSWSNSGKYSTAKLDEVITATASDGTNNGKYYTSDQTWRFYGSESGTLTLSAEAGYSIQSVTIVFTLKDSGKLLFGGAEVTSGTAVEVNDSSAVFSVGGESKGKVFVKSISVTYVAE